MLRYKGIKYVYDKCLFFLFFGVDIDILIDRLKYVVTQLEKKLTPQTADRPK